MLMKRFTRPFRQLRGKLTLSYTLTSVVTFLLVELTFIGIIFWFISLNSSGLILSSLKQEAPQASPCFVHGVADRCARRGAGDRYSQSVQSSAFSFSLFLSYCSR